jgi:ABC-type lipoprotein release transport system permease subunit
VGDPAAVSNSIAAAVRSVDHEYPMTRVRTYNVGAIDVRALLGVATILVASVLLACYAPARGATKIDPMTALRQE